MSGRHWDFLSFDSTFSLSNKKLRCSIKMKQIYFFLYVGTPRPQNDPAKNVEWRSKCTEIGQEGFDISSVESKSRQEKRALKSSTLLSLKAREIWVKEAWPSYLATSLPHSHTLLSWKELSPAESTDFNNKYGAQNRKPDTERPYATKTARLRVQSQEKTLTRLEKRQR